MSPSPCWLRLESEADVTEPTLATPTESEADVGDGVDDDVVIECRLVTQAGDGGNRLPSKFIFR